MTTRTVGLTRDAGYQVGVSRTLPLPASAVWGFMAGPEGLALWLGPGAEVDLRRGGAHRTADGVVGEVRGYREGERLRATRRSPDGAESTVQFTVSARGDRTVLTFHEERLNGPEERAARRGHWKAVMAAVEAALLPA
ncbi:hypothetical protein SUDANB121_03889 [Nocardiopsis dassonvillei]|uniref:SRPBCC family protein n=1 Tax=Nocardiopsis dassonvillei TaxID=2014 RepID=UPI003F5702BB